MKLERLSEDRIPKNLSQHWQNLQDAAGAGHLHTDVGMREEHQRLRLARVALWAVAFAYGSAQQQGTILEIGCCEGAMTAEMQAHVKHILAIDFVQSLLDECPHFDNVEYQLADVSTWTPPTDFDVIVMGEVLEHLENPIGVLRRMSIYGHYIVASCPVNEELNHDTAWDMSKIDDLLTGRQKVEAGEGAGHIWAMDSEGFHVMFEQAGLDIVHSEFIEPSEIIVARSLVRGNSG